MTITIESEIAELRQMTTGELAQRYREVFGEETRTRHKTFLIRKIAWRLQAVAEGDLTTRARQRAAELANDADIRVTPPGKTALDLTPIEQPDQLNTDRRLPSPGTAITRQYKGRTVQVVVLPDGFEYQGLRYKSLSAVARIITGSHCNGFRFFRLEATR